jgi:hypothetical protein
MQVIVPFNIHAILCALALQPLLSHGLTLPPVSVNPTQVTTKVAASLSTPPSTLLIVALLPTQTSRPFPSPPTTVIPDDYATPSETTPSPTDPADITDGADVAEAEAEANERFRQTTYWSCVRWSGEATAHCGWHEPVLDASLPNAAGAGAVGQTGKGVGQAAVMGAMILVILGW